MDWVTLQVRGQVATLTLNDPKRKNALSPELGDALRDKVHMAAEQARAIVLMGADGNFSSGGDIQMLQRLRSMPYEEAKAFMLAFYARFFSVRDVPVPVIAAVEGYAIGAGFCLALACDALVVAEDAKVALNFAKLGLAPGLGATVLAPRWFGPGRAFQLLATGETISGKDVPAVVAKDAIATAHTLAEQMAANAPLVVRQLKERFAVDIAQALDDEAAGQALTYASRDLGEGLAAAKDKRPARFEGL